MKIKHRHGHIRVRSAKTGKAVNYVYTNPETQKSKSKTWRFPVSAKERQFIEQEIGVIEAEIDLFKYGRSESFTYGRHQVNTTSLQALADRFYKDPLRKINLDWKTNKRAKESIELFLSIVGKDVRMKDIVQHNFVELFKTQLYNIRKDKKLEGNKAVDADKIKRGINVELRAIRGFLNHCGKKGWIPRSTVPEVEMYSVNRPERREVFSENDLFVIEDALRRKIRESEGRKKQVSGDILLAFYIFRYSGARAIEVCKNYKDGRGLKWQDIDWIKRHVSLFAKRKKKIVPLHDRLYDKLFERRQELGAEFRPDVHVIGVSHSYVSTCFKRVYKELGIYNKGDTVHILRHSFATLLQVLIEDLDLVRQLLRQEQIYTTQDYTHVEVKFLREKINKLA